MTQTLTPDLDLLDRGIGSDDLEAAGTALTEVGIDFRNDGNLVLALTNASGGVVTATLVATPDPQGRGGGGVNDVPITIPAGKTGFFPFMSIPMFQTGGATTTAITLSAFASVTATLIRLGKAR